MNPERERSTDPTFEPETPEVRERLDAIERRLKAARPRPPRLDMVALERRAAERPVPAAIDRGGRSRRFYRRVAVVAASWACGAIAGALVMYVAMSRSTPGADSTTATARVEKETPAPSTRGPIAAPGGEGETEAEAERHDDPIPVEAPESLKADDALLAMIIEQWAAADSGLGAERPAFRAGMHLVPIAVEPGRTDRPPRAVRQRTVTPELDPGPHRPITRDRLLDDLLREMSASGA